MTAATVPGIDDAPTENARLLSWVREVAELTTPDRVVWCDGSDEEWERVTTRLVEAGTFVRLTAKPNSFWAASDPDDVARVEERTFICSLLESDAGVTNNWCDPAEMKAMMTELYRGCMRGRTMYVIPFCMGPTTAEQPMLGVEITDSEYVVASMKIMTRMGASVLPLFDGPAGDDFVPRPALGRRAAGARPGRRAVAVQRHQVHQRTSRRTGRSGATAPATAATRCWARSATRCGSPRRWPATRAGSPSTC